MRTIFMSSIRCETQALKATSHSAQKFKITPELMLKNLPSNCQVHFSSSFSLEEDEHQVFEVNEEIIAALIKTGSLQIKGPSKDEDAILATNNKTYKLQRRLYSNSFLFASREDNSDDNRPFLLAHTLKEHLLDVIPHNPQCNKIFAFLYENRLREEDQMDILDSGFPFDNLLDNYQISEEELQNFLKRINACNIGNRWFLVDENFLVSIFHDLLYKMRVKKYDIQEIVYPQVLEDLQIDKPKQLVLNAMQEYMELTRVTDGQMIFQTTYELICKMIAKQLLLERETYIWSEFRPIFRKMIETFCPISLYEEVSEEVQLKIESSCFLGFGILVDENNLSSNFYTEQRMYIKYVNALSLPSDIKERLKVLFKIKKKYFYEELVAYLRDLVQSSKELDEVLMKNSRAIYERISKNIYPAFSKNSKSFSKNITEDKSSNGSFWDVRYLVCKY